MKFKEGVNPFGIRPELMIGLIIIDNIYKNFGPELVVTSINDSKHSLTSLHYSGQAADLRTHYFTGATQVSLVAEAIRDALGRNPDYDVVIEKDHIHFEYQPKYRGA
jgi:hypothetical protein